MPGSQSVAGREPSEYGATIGASNCTDDLCRWLTAAQPGEVRPHPRGRAMHPRRSAPSWVLRSRAAAAHTVRRTLLASGRGPAPAGT